MTLDGVAAEHILLSNLDALRLHDHEQKLLANWVVRYEPMQAVEDTCHVFLIGSARVSPTEGVVADLPDVREDAIAGDQVLARLDTLVTHECASQRWSFRFFCQTLEVSIRVDRHTTSKIAG